jgi:poly(A) polymerase
VKVPERLAALAEWARPIALRFADAGESLYLVGGAVRDLLLGTKDESIDELDFATSASPEKTLEIIRPLATQVWTVGIKFGTVGAKVGGKRLEVTTFRAERYDSKSRKPHVSYVPDLQADLARRDFTINSMALDPLTLALIDPFGGVADLAARVLRTPGDPRSSFTDDPLRMMRAARFVAALELSVAEEVEVAATELAPLLSKVSRERVRDELNRLLCLEDPTKGLEFLLRTRLFDQFMPEVPALALEQDPVHRHKDVLAHTLAVVRQVPPDLALRMAALLHDIGKPATRKVTEEGVTFHYHDVVGAKMARSRLRELRYPKEFVEEVSRLVELHLRPHTLRLGWTDKAVRRYVRDAGPLLAKLNVLVRADCTTRNERKRAEIMRRLDELEARIEDLRRREELGQIRPEIDGHRVMELLGIPPGPEVGEAMRFLLELRMEEGLLGAEEVERRLLAWWEGRKKAGDREGDRVLS